MSFQCVTYGQLQRFLLKLEFADLEVQPQWKALQHKNSDTVILLANRPPEQVAREPDLMSIRRHLYENAVVPEGQFDQLLADAA